MQKNFKLPTPEELPIYVAEKYGNVQAILLDMLLDKIKANLGKGLTDFLYPNDRRPDSTYMDKAKEICAGFGWDLITSHHPEEIKLLPLKQEGIPDGKGIKGPTFVTTDYIFPTGEIDKLTLERGILTGEVWDGEKYVPEPSAGSMTATWGVMDFGDVAAEQEQ